MHASTDAEGTTQRAGHRVPAAIRALGIVILLAVTVPPSSLPAQTTPVKIAVFDFELEDVSAAGALSNGEMAGDLERMLVVTTEARRVLAQSERYRLVDVGGADDEPVRKRSLRNCDGCDARIARKLGAEQSLVGVVRRVAQTEYYVSIRITDTATGAVINQQSAFYTGSDDAWKSGVRSLIRRTVLAAPVTNPE